MRSLFLPIGLLTVVGVAASAACTATVSTPGFVAVVSTPGVSLGFATAYGSCGELGYAVAPADDCDGLVCSDTYYAVCNGAAWAGCYCTTDAIFAVYGDSFSVIASP